MSAWVVPAGALPPVSGGRTFPLSYQQEWTCLAASLHPPVIADPRYCIHLVMRLHGPVDAEILQGALDDVVARHSALRTRFAGAPDGTAVQEELPTARRPLIVREARQETPEAVIASMTLPAAPFEDPPALRVELARLGDEDFVLGVGVHHLACDATGVVLLAQDLSRAYQLRLEGARLPEAPLGYGDFAAWFRASRADRFDDDLAWWRALVKDFRPAPLRLDHPFSPGVPANNRVLRMPLLDAPALAAVQRRALACRSSLFVTLLAVTEVLMAARSPSEDRLVLAFLDQRDHPSTRDMIGYFLNPIGVRFLMPPDEPLAKLLGRLTRRVLDVSERAYVPTFRLIDAVPELFGSVIGVRPPTAAFVQHQARPIPADYRLGDARGRVVASGVRGPSEPGLTLKYLPMAEGGMDLEAGYEARHFDEASIRKLMAGVREVLLAFAGDDGSATPRGLLDRVGGW